MYPLKTTPLFKQYIWGGDNMKKLYNKDIPGIPTAESWEVACHPNGTVTVANGKLAGATLSEIIEKAGSDLLGDNISTDEKFPLLLKVLDAKDKLSVQVHPNDEYAAINENGEKGKTEMWYVLSAEPGAQLIYGFKEGVTKQGYADAIENGTLEDILNYVDVNAGDVFFIPAGTVHAIGAGLIIAEMQQNSDTTYRVYDYNRTDKDGNKRELHIAKALDVSDISPPKGSVKSEGVTAVYDDNTAITYVTCEYFAFEEVSIKSEIELKTDGKMQILFFAEGAGNIIHTGDPVWCDAGDSVIIPAATKEFSIVGKCKVLKFWVPSN